MKPRNLARICSPGLLLTALRGLCARQVVQLLSAVVEQRPEVWQQTVELMDPVTGSAANRHTQCWLSLCCAAEVVTWNWEQLDETQPDAMHQFYDKLFASDPDGVLRERMLQLREQLGKDLCLELVNNNLCGGMHTPIK